MSSTLNMQRRYKHLFRLPSTRASFTISILVVLCLGLAALLASGVVSFGFQYTLLPSLPVFLLLSLWIEKILLKDYPLAIARRLMVLSYAGNILWVFLMLLGWLISPWSAKSVSSLYTLGFFVTVSFRFLVLASAVCGEYVRSLLVSVLQPFLLILPVSLLNVSTFSLSLLPFVAGLIFLASVGIYLYAIDRSSGDRGLPSLKMLRAFLEAWASDKSDLIEHLIEAKSKVSVIKTYLLSFLNGNGRPTVVVSDVHPGPFANVGSSNITYEMHKTLTGKGYSPLILHSFSSHDMNLPSKEQVRLMLESLDNLTPINESDSCTEFITLTHGKATVNGIAFDKTALLIITLAPEGMEDFPQRVGERVKALASDLGFKEVIIVDAHNSQGEINGEEDLNDIVEASKTALEKLSVAPRHRFKVGYSHSDELDLKFKQDVGGGGLGVLLLEVGGKKFLLVGADANNAIRGLRKRVLDEARLDDVSIVDICTSDTHFASGKGRTPRGYSPLGELTPPEQIVEAVKSLAEKAGERLAGVKLVLQTSYAKVKVMGEEILREFSNILDRATKAAKTGGKAIILELLVLIVILVIV